MNKRRMSIQRKLTLFTMGVFLLPLTVWVIFAFNVMNERLYDTRLASARNSLDHVGVAMSQHIENCHLYASQISSDQEVLRLVRGKNTEGQVVAAYGTHLEPLFAAIRGQDPIVETFHIVHGNPTLFNVYDVLYRVDDIDEYVQRIAQSQPSGQEKNVQYYREGPEYRFYYTTLRNDDCWMVRSVIRVRGSYHPYGVVEVVANNQELYKAMDRLSLSPGDFLWLMDGEEQVIHGKALAPGGGERRPLENGDGWQDESIVALTYALPTMNATLVYAMERSTWTLADTEVRLLVLLLVCSLAGMLLLTRLVSRTLFLRLTRLSQRMDSISTHHDLSLAETPTGDEIDRLNEHFVQMLARMEKVSETEKQLIFNDLTNDLKPHFICNAMDMLQLQAERAGQRELSCSVRQISQYFRYSMLRDKGGVTLLSELDDVRNYTDLINAMRENKVYLEVELDDWAERNAERLIVPKMLLQPLVDNAVRHGIRAATGVVRIRVRRVGPDVKVQVEDNGEGMSPVRVQKLRCAMAGSPQWDGERRHVGIANVIMRMEIFFSGKYTFDFVTSPDSGTIFTLTLLGVGK